MIAALFNPVTILLATMGLQWVVLTEVGAFTLLVPYFTLGMVALYAPFAGRRWHAGFMYIRQNAIWIVPIAIYLIVVTPVLLGTPAENTSPRQIFYLICGIALAACIATARNLATIFRVGAALGLFVFVGFVELLARDIGLSWVDAIKQFFGSGNLHFVIYSFFTPIFNSLDPAGDMLIKASRKNDIAACLLVIGLLFRSASVRPQRDIVGMLFIGAALVLLIMLNDRSVLIVTGLSLLIATVVGTLTRPISNIPLLVLKVVALLALLVFALGLVSPSSGFLGTLAERFSFSDGSTASRMEQYQTALSRIEKHPFLGSGYSEVDGHAIHNAFLGAWMYAGLAAFLLVVTFYAAVLFRWMAFLTTVATRPERWILPVAVEWIAPLPFMPLFRVWMSGEGGLLKFGEWIAISVFFGCCLANELRLRAGARVRQQWVASSAAQASYAHGLGAEPMRSMGRPGALRSARRT